MKLSFTKMDGLGNDFVMIDDMEGAIELEPRQVAYLCDRHFGIGGDGVILVRPSEKDDCAGYMHYYNADGSLAQMCGNGVRCFSKFLIDHGYVDASAGSFVADTLAGRRPISFQVDEAGKMTVATVDMGQPILAAAEVPVALPENAQYEEVGYVRETAIESPWGAFEFTCVSMGNPHAITFIEDFQALPDAIFDDPSNKSLETLNLNTVGRFYESNPAFPEKANIEFIQVCEDGLHMRVYERGDGETLACGTGACASNVAAALTGRAGRVNDVHLRGGVLHIDWSSNEHVFMTGPAAASFTGEIEID